jgi:hypothetical protein
MHRILDEADPNCRSRAYSCTVYMPPVSLGKTLLISNEPRSLPLKALLVRETRIWRWSTFTPPRYAANAALRGPFFAPARTAQQQTLWVLKVMNEIGTVRAGMTRKELLKVFKEEGGISTRTHRTYAYKGCPYIKVNAVFSSVTRRNRRAAKTRSSVSQARTSPTRSWINAPPC